MADCEAQEDTSSQREDAAPVGSRPSPLPNTRTRKRTKTGCLTCRKRRIKCDERHPTCGNCIKSKRNCEGYSQRVIFKPPIAGWSNQYGYSTTPYLGSTLPGTQPLYHPQPLSTLPLASLTLGSSNIEENGYLSTNASGEYWTEQQAAHSSPPSHLTPQYYSREQAQAQTQAFRPPYSPEEPSRETLRGQKNVHQYLVFGAPDDPLEGATAQAYRQNFKSSGDERRATWSLADRAAAAYVQCCKLWNADDHDGSRQLARLSITGICVNLQHEEDVVFSHSADYIGKLGRLMRRSSCEGLLNVSMPNAEERPVLDTTPVKSEFQSGDDFTQPKSAFSPLLTSSFTAVAGLSTAPAPPYTAVAGLSTAPTPPYTATRVDSLEERVRFLEAEGRMVKDMLDEQNERLDMLLHRDSKPPKAMPSSPEDVRRGPRTCCDHSDKEIKLEIEDSAIGTSFDDTDMELD